RGAACQRLRESIFDEADLIPEATSTPPGLRYGVVRPRPQSRIEPFAIVGLSSERWASLQRPRIFPQELLELECRDVGPVLSRFERRGHRQSVSSGTMCGPCSTDRPGRAVCAFVNDCNRISVVTAA